MVFIINKILLQTAFAFVPATWDWPLVIMIFVAAFWLWYLYQFNDPYYNEKVSKMFKALSGYYMWTCFMLLVAKALEKTSFKGGLISWLLGNIYLILGLPFIVVIILSQSNRNLKSLAKNEIKFETASELMDHLRLVQQLIEKYKTDKNSYLLLAGYIEQHKDVCIEEDCPLKISKKKLRKDKSELDMTFDEAIARLNQVIERMYVAGLKEFKTNARLRIAYALFLLDRKESQINQNRALEELEIAKQLNPKFDEEFLIYRYTKMITESVNDKQGGGEDDHRELDVVGLIAFDNYKRQCIEGIRQASSYHKAFWMELLEDMPSKLF